MAWLGAWAKRVKLTIDKDDIDAALSNFPILVYISASSGINSDDISCVFDELTSDDNRKKIAITKSDGQTQCYVEIEKWDDANEKAWLWVKVPSVSSSVDTDLYLYYDANQDNNTDYVGDPNSTPAENVWDEHFKLVCHMRDDPDNEHVRDSTGNDNDGDKVAAGAPAVTTEGKISDAQDFDGEDDYINHGAEASLNPTGAITLEAWAKTTFSGGGAWKAILNSGAGWSAGYMLFAGANTTKKPRVYLRSVTGGDLTADTAISEGVETHLTATYNGSTVAIYINGLLDKSQEASGSISHFNELLVGIDGGLLYPFNGLIDEVRIADTGRSAAWIKASYESGLDDLLDFGSEELLPKLLTVNVITSQYRSVEVITAQNRAIKRITSMYRTIKNFTTGG